MTTPETRPIGLATPFRHLPNAISVMRMVLVVPAGWLLWQNAVAEALVLIAIAGISDAVDGLLARRYDWRTRFGAIADPAADKLLSLVVFVVLAVQGHVPWWLLGIVVGRDLVIVFGAMAYRHVLGNFDVEPTLLSKVNTGLQVVMLLLVVVGLADFGWVATIAATVVDPIGFVVVGMSCVLSGLHYVVVWSLRAASGIRERREDA